MTRWLVWACGGLLVAAGFAWRSSAPEPRTSAPPTPAAGPSSEARRLLNDDRLTPPPEDAPPDVRRAYEEAVEAIAAGRDPLRQASPNAELLKRLGERRHAAQIRKEEVRKASDQRRAERRARIDAKSSQRTNPSAAGRVRTAPDPAISRPDPLPAPLKDVEESP